MSFSVEHGTFSYSSKPLLNDVNLSVSQGEMLSILGPNGIGKTTLLKCMMGFLRWQDGASYINGQRITEMKESDIWKRIAYVPQAKATAFSFTGLEMALIGRSPHLGPFEQPRQHDVEIAEAALGRIGVMRLRDKPCNQMSGGELQMVLIARALATEPRLLILDEPESGLDFRNQLIILELLERLTRKEGLAAIVNTHYPSHALRISDKTLILSGEGRYYYGQSTDVINAENMQAAFGVDVAFDRIEAGSRTLIDVVPIDIIPEACGER